VGAKIDHKLYENSLTVTGVLAGIIFAAMTFLMQSRGQISFPQWLPSTIEEMANTL